jgi:hypothetical protein
MESRKFIRMLLTAVLLLILIPSITSYAQKETARNSIYLELLGNGVFYSINYDREFNDYLGMRVGLSYLPGVSTAFSTTEDIIMIPVMINTFIGNGNSKFELGAGIVYEGFTHSTIFGSSDSQIIITTTIGYRYQQKAGGLIFRIGFTPLITERGYILPFGGISIGTSF